MTVEEAEEKFNALKAEAKEIAAGLKEWNKRYKKLAKKAVSLHRKMDYDKNLYLEDGEGPDGWEIRTLFRLNDFDGYEDYVEGAMILCENLAKWKFKKRKPKVKKCTGYDSEGFPKKNSPWAVHNKDCDVCDRDDCPLTARPKDEEREKQERADRRRRVALAKARRKQEYLKLKKEFEREKPDERA